MRAAANVMDVDVVAGAVRRARADDRRRRSERRSTAIDGVFAVVASAGTTNTGAVDRLDEIADVCAARDLWLHVDGAYGLAALCAPSAAARLAGIDRADSFGVDPHKWLFAPYDCAALVYRDPALAAQAHSQHGAYLDVVDRSEWNPSDFAYHLTRRARGLPLWFSLATYGTEAYTAAVETTLDTARGLAALLRDRPEFDLLLDPDLSVVLFAVRGWEPERYHAWSGSRAKAGMVFIVPTTWDGEICYRVCIIDPRTTLEQLGRVLDDMAAFD